MMVTGPDGRDTEVVGPVLADGEVYVLDGRTISATELWATYRPGLDRRLAQRRTEDRRRNRTRTRRSHARRIRDRLTAREILALARGPEYVAIYRVEGV